MFVERNNGKCCGVFGGKETEKDVLHILKKGLLCVIILHEKITAIKVNN